MTSDQYTDRPPTQREEWEAADHYTSHPPPQREERRVSNQYANRPPQQEGRRVSDQYANRPPPRQPEQASLLTIIKRKVGFWLAASAGSLLIFLIIGLSYGYALDWGLINSGGWMMSAGLLIGFVASVWLFGEWLKMKFGRPSIFN